MLSGDTQMYTESRISNRDSAGITTNEISAICHFAVSDLLDICLVDYCLSAGERCERLG
jgi:hypothetical protein